MDNTIRRHGVIKGDLQHPVVLGAFWKNPFKVSMATGDLNCLSPIGNLFTPCGINILLRLWQLFFDAMESERDTPWRNGAITVGKAPRW